MAVYTEVGFDAAGALCARLGLGQLVELQGISSGIENTNYFAATERGHWVLTLFERLTRADLPYYLKLMQHLSRAGIPVPAPQADTSGELLHELAGKPAAIVTRLPGSHRLAPARSQLEQVGEMLARMHIAGRSFALEQPHLRGLAWWRETVPVVLPHLRGSAEGEAAAAAATLLQSELRFQQDWAATPAGQALPRGPIHADLFRDNVMFDDGAGSEDRLSGFVDFYFAGTEHLLFDVAVCLNDWCTDAVSGRLDETSAAAFVAAYHGQRPLVPLEQRMLPALLRAAAFRFWLSRLWDWHLPRAHRLLEPKDPAHFERVLRECIASPWHPDL